MPGDEEDTPLDHYVRGFMPHGQTEGTNRQIDRERHNERQRVKRGCRVYVCARTHDTQACMRAVRSRRKSVQGAHSSASREEGEGIKKGTEPLRRRGKGGDQARAWDARASERDSGDEEFAEGRREHERRRDRRWEERRKAREEEEKEKVEFCRGGGE